MFVIDGLLKYFVTVVMYKSFTLCRPMRDEKSALAQTWKDKEHLHGRDGIIVVNHGYNEDVSRSWIIHIPREHVVKLAFFKFDVEDTCGGICECNYLAVKIHSNGRNYMKYCNERIPSQRLISRGRKVRLHLRVRGHESVKNVSFKLKYKIITSNIKQGRKIENFANYVKQNYGHHNDKTGKRKTWKLVSNVPVLAQETGENEPAYRRREIENDAINVRVRKLVPSRQVTDVTKTTEDPGPSKLTILLAIAIPVVVIFLLVVLLIAYYNYYTDMKQKESGEEVQRSGMISEFIMNTSVTLTPMFNLGKARRESSARKEKASKLYDDMLQNWKTMNDDRKKRERAREESVMSWESYKKYKQRRNTKDGTGNESEALAMLINNAINVNTNPSQQTIENDSSEITDTDEIKETSEEKPRTNSILVKRDSDKRINRGSKVLSWNDLSTEKTMTEKGELEKSTSSDIELKTKSRSSSGSSHIPAIVVSQPSVETEDDEAEANDTARLIKDSRDGAKITNGDENNTATSTCSDQVKDILRESYGDETEKWFQKPKKTSSQGSLHRVIADPSVKYQVIQPDDVD